MATKKQKRAAALAKREKFMQDLRESGLEAQSKDREARETREKEMTDLAREYNRRTNRILALRLLRPDNY